MDNKFTSRDTLRKRKAREKETSSQREKRLAKDREYKKQKRGKENVEKREVRLARDKERKRVKLTMETDEQREKRLNNLRGRRTYLKNLAQNQNIIEQDLNSQQQPQQESPQQESGQATSTRDNVVRSGKLSKFERGLLKKFRDKVDKFKHTLCPTCNESFPSITLVKGECRRCYAEKISPKEVSDELQAEKTFPEKFSAENNMDPNEISDEQATKTLPKKFLAENNMDPGEVPDELQDLNEIEKMLIARVFPVMSVYKLRGGQHGYRGNVINFPQDVLEFTTKLS